MKVDEFGMAEVEVGGVMQRRRVIIDMTRTLFGPSRVLPEVYSNEMLIERIGMDPIIVRVNK